MSHQAGLFEQTSISLVEKKSLVVICEPCSLQPCTLLYLYSGETARKKESIKLDKPVTMNLCYMDVKHQLEISGCG